MPAPTSVDIIETGYFIRFSTAFQSMFLKNAADIVGALEAIVNHISVLENIHHQYRAAAGEVPDLMLVNPLVKQRRR